jgi:hypothetical protein
MLHTYTIQRLEEANLRRGLKLSFLEKLDIIQYVRMAELNLKVDA